MIRDVDIVRLSMLEALAEDLVTGYNVNHTSKYVRERATSTVIMSRLFGVVSKGFPTRDDPANIARDTTQSRHLDTGMLNILTTQLSKLRNTGALASIDEAVVTMWLAIFDEIGRYQSVDAKTIALCIAKYAEEPDAASSPLHFAPFKAVFVWQTHLTNAIAIHKLLTFFPRPASNVLP